MIQFLERAHRRQVLHSIVHAAALAGCAACGFLTLLLVLGTEILHPFWLLASGIFAFAAGLYQLVRGLPGRYRLAQRIDQQLGWRDALSTAWYFRDAEGPVFREQRRFAEELTRGADPAAAVPFAAPRSALVLACFVALAAGLFTTRYLVTDSLSLKAPVADLDFGLFDSPSERADNRRSAIREMYDEQFRKVAPGLDPVDDHPGDRDELPVQPAAMAATPDGKAPMESREVSGEDGNEKDAAQGTRDPQSAGKNSDASDGDDGALDLEGISLNNKPSQKQGQAANPARSGKPQNGLLDKMREAMANLMAKMNLGSQQSEGEGQEAGGESGDGEAQQASTEGGKQGPGRGRGQGDQQGEEGADQQADGSEAAQGNGKSQRGGGSQPGSSQASSGVGKQDGDKAIREAEQLAAMGKISEILGKRAQQVQGEMIVEAPGGKQQLKTGYTGKSATHTDAGAEIGRETIPLEHQSYVQRYFENLRKATGSKARS